MSRTAEFVRIDGFIFAITKEGRFRRNWKNTIRARDRHPFPKKGKCERCGQEKMLTTHHEPPLYISVEGKKIRLCEECHTTVEQECNEKYNLKNKPYITRCPYCRSKTYLDKLKGNVYCKNKHWGRKLYIIGKGEYSTREAVGQES